MKMNVTDTVKQACGHWPRILPALGMKVIKNRHQACPVCGGADRFRFDDKEGRGTWFCNQCGAGDGLKLVEKVFGISASEAAGKVNAVTGHLPPVAPEVTAAAEAETEADRKAAAALAVRLLEKTRPATGNAYLTRKGFAGRECLTLTASHKTGGVAYRAGDVVVPLYDGTGTLVNLQLINADGLKRTLKGGQVKGACHLIDGQKQAGKRLWMSARALLQSQQNSDEALSIKRDADPTFDFCGYLEALPQTNGMFMGNASIIPRNYRKYLYHAYLAYMEANGYRNVLSLKMFGLGLPMMLKEYGMNYEKRHTKQGIQTNLSLKEESYGDWLPKCDEPTAT